MKNDYIIRKLYTSFVMVSILSSLTATIGFLIDNIIVGRTLGSVELGAMGIIGPISIILSVFGSVCGSGGTARAAQAIGRGDTEQFRRIFTLALSVALLCGAAITLIGLLFTPQIASVLGAKDALLQPSVEYLHGYFLGAIPTILTSAMLGFIKIDGSPQLPLLSIIAMTITNIALDLIFVLVFGLGMFGMALATALSYCVAVLVACTHFFKKTATLRLMRPKNVAQELGAIISTGAPSALGRVFETIKNAYLNNLLVATVGITAVTAFSVRTQAGSFFGSLILGMSQATLPLFSMFFGEEDRESLKDTLKTSLKIGLIVNVIGCILLIIFAPFFVGLLGVTDPATKAIAVTAVRMYALTMPLMLINFVFTNYFQSTRSTRKAIILCVFETLIFTVAFATVLIYPFGTTGVWMAFIFTEIATLILQVVLAFIDNKAFPRSLYDFMQLGDDFGVPDKDRLELSIGNSMEEVMSIAEGITHFGSHHNVNQQTLNKLSLAIEEMAGNVVRHAFKPGEKKWFDLMILDKPDSLIVRLRDNGSTFDPVHFAQEHPTPDDHQLGIRLISGIAENMEYRRTLGLNTLMITLKK